MNLDDAKRQDLLESIKRFAEEQLEIEIGDLKAGFFLDYCLEEICPTVYNQAIKDAQAFFFAKIEDLEGSCYEPELEYWARRGRKSDG